MFETGHKVEKSHNMQQVNKHGPVQCCSLNKANIDPIMDHRIWFIVPSISPTAKFGSGQPETPYIFE